MLYANGISFFVTSKCQKSEQLMKILNIEEKNLHIFWTNWGISTKFSGKMCLMIILKVTKKQGFTLSLRIIILEKSQVWGPNCQIDPLCIALRGNIPLGGNSCYKWMKIEKINFKSIKISTCGITLYWNIFLM